MKEIDRKIIISVIIVLVGIVAVAGVLLQNIGEIPSVENITVNETHVTPPEPIEPPVNETRIQTNISKEEAMRIAEEAYLDFVIIAPELAYRKSVDARLFQLREEHMIGWSPENREEYRYRRHPIWIWNVTVRYPEGFLPGGKIYDDTWVDAQTGRALILMAQ